MLNPFIRIVITQEPSREYPNRSNNLIFDYVNHCEVFSSSSDMIQKASIKLPLKDTIGYYIITPNSEGYRSETGKINLKDYLISSDGDKEPLFMRGDIIKIIMGYETFDKVNPAVKYPAQSTRPFSQFDDGGITYPNGPFSQFEDEIVNVQESKRIKWFKEYEVIFEGFLTKINYGIPIELEAEDVMWVLKQTQIPVGVKELHDTLYTTVTDKDGKTTKISGGTGYATSNTKNGKSVEKLINLMIENSYYGVAEVDGSGNELKDSNGTIIRRHKLSEYFAVKTDNVTSSIGDWMLDGNHTIFQFLEEIKSKARFNSFFRRIDAVTDPEGRIIEEPYYMLHCGVVKYYYDNMPKVPINLGFQRNIISDNLTYQRDDDVRIQLIANGMTSDDLIADNERTNANKSNKNKKQKKLKYVETVGDPDGDIRTIFLYPPKDFDGQWFSTTDPKYGKSTIKLDPTDTTNTTYKSAKLREMAWQWYPNVKAETSKGSIVTFGFPRIQHGDIVKLEDKILTMRNGNEYLVKSVRTTFGMDGYRQEIELDLRFDTYRTKVTSPNVNGSGIDYNEMMIKNGGI